MAKISIRTDVIDVVAGPDVCVLTFKDANVDRSIDFSNFPEGIPRLPENELKPQQQDLLSSRYPDEVYVLKDLMNPEKDDEHYLIEATKVWKKASEDERAQFKTKYRREIDLLNIENKLREAIRAGDTGEAEHRLNELAGRNSEHKILDPATVLIEALGTAHPHEPVTALMYQDRLEGEWASAGEAIFGKRAKALLTPFWRAVGQALENMAFDPAHPDRHASRAYLECGDWKAVIRVVQAEDKFEKQPVLIERMAKALWQIDQGLQALACWFVLCRFAPEDFKSLIEDGRIPFESFLDKYLYLRNEIKARRKKKAKELLAPFWRVAGQALESMAFDPVHSDRHASRAYQECGDWEAVIRVAQAEDGFEKQPVLLTRLAEARWQNKQDKQAIECWFKLCWLDQRYFEELIESEHFPAPWLVEYWNQAMDVDIECDEPDISVEWFPAWVLLCDPRRACFIKSRGAKAGPQRAFDLVRTLVTSSDEQLDMRKELKDIHPVLFRRFLELHR